MVGGTMPLSRQITAMTNSSAPGGPEQMAVHGLRGTYGNRVRPLAENFLDCGGLGGIVLQRGGAVRVDVADLVGIEPGRRERRLHGPPGLRTEGRVMCEASLVNP